MRKFFTMRKNQRRSKLADMQLLAALIRGAEIQETDNTSMPADYDPFDEVTL